MNGELFVGKGRKRTGLATFELLNFRISASRLGKVAQITYGVIPLEESMWGGGGGVAWPRGKEREEGWDGMVEGNALAAPANPGHHQTVHHTLPPNPSRFCAHRKGGGGRGSKTNGRLGTGSDHRWCG